MTGQYSIADAGRASSSMTPSDSSSAWPPLASGWTEHIGPQGQVYWYNEVVGQSTYIRPTAAQNGHTDPGASTVQQGGPVQRVKREKPAKKEEIPGAEGWRKVTTNFGNVFYAHIPTKRSEWTVPEEIRAQVEAVRAEERRVEEEKRKAERQQAEKRRREEQEKLEAERAKRRKIEEEDRRRRRELEEAAREQARQKRLEAERVHADRMRILREAQTAQTDAQCFEPASADKVNTEAVDDEEEDEEAWQRRIASEMAQSAEMSDTGTIETAQAETAGNDIQVLALSSQEARAVFLHMLTSLNGTPKEVNPMMPWDRELPKFAQERDFTVLASMREREDAFNEWCRLRIIEKRKGKATEKNTATSASPKDEQSSDDRAREVFRTLLETEVKSTRTTWEDFRKLWRKDRRFYGFGRDDKERERNFREWLRELGKRKQAAAAAADEAFVALLGDVLSSAGMNAATPWQEAKSAPGLSTDPRYDAVGSSTRRAELYDKWAKTRQGSSDAPEIGQQRHASVMGDKDEAKADKSADAATRALQERAEKVQRERAALDRQKHRTIGQAAHEDSMLQYRQLLVDAVSDPLATMQSARAALSRDDRFHLPGLRADEKEALFYRHTGDLNQRRLRSLEDVFLRHAPGLDTEDDVALPLIKDDDEIRRRKLDDVQEIVYQRQSLEDVYHSWKGRREQGAKVDFTQMLKENAFIDFWGRLRQELAQCRARGQDVEKFGPAGDDDDDDEDAGAPSLLQMAKQIDLEEIHAILRSDARYRAWRHKPALREEWIRDYLQQMEIPKMSHFQQTHS